MESIGSKIIERKSKSKMQNSRSLFQNSVVVDCIGQMSHTLINYLLIKLQKWPKAANSDILHFIQFSDRNSESKAAVILLLISVPSYFRKR